MGPDDPVLITCAIPGVLATPSHAVEDVRAITEAIRDEVGDAAIVNCSTGAVCADPFDELVALLQATDEHGIRMLVAAALTRGGSVRACLEDDLCLPERTIARSNPARPRVAGGEAPPA